MVFDDFSLETIHILFTESLSISCEVNWFTENKDKSYLDWNII